MSELHDNAGSHNYYLSLIVNHKTQYCAKIALVAERVIKSQATEDYLVIKGSTGKEDRIDLISDAKKDKTEKVLVHMDCEIIFEQDEFFEKRVEEVCKPKTIGYTDWQAKAADKYKDYYTGYSRNEWDDFYDPQTGGRNREKDVNKTQLNVFEQGEIPFDSLKVKTFLIKWLAQDVLCEDKLSDVLKDLSKTSRGKSVDSLLEKLDETIKTYFAFTFYGTAQQVTINEQEQLCKQCITELYKYKTYSITQDIIDTLDLYVIGDIQNKSSNKIDETIYD